MIAVSLQAPDEDLSLGHVFGMPLRSYSVAIDAFHGDSAIARMEDIRLATKLRLSSTTMHKHECTSKKSTDAQYS